MTTQEELEGHPVFASLLANISELAFGLIPKTVKHDDGTKIELVRVFMGTRGEVEGP